MLFIKSNETDQLKRLTHFLVIIIIILIIIQLNIYWSKYSAFSRYYNQYTLDIIQLKMSIYKYISMMYFHVNINSTH